MVKRERKSILYLKSRNPDGNNGIHEVSTCPALHGHLFLPYHRATRKRQLWLTIQNRIDRWPHRRPYNVEKWMHDRWRTHVHNTVISMYNSIQRILLHPQLQNASQCAFYIISNEYFIYEWEMNERWRKLFVFNSGQLTSQNETITFGTAGRLHMWCTLFLMYLPHSADR